MAMAITLLSSAPACNSTPRLNILTPKIQSSPVALRRTIPRVFAFSGAKMTRLEFNSSLAVKKKGAEILEDLKGTSIFLVGMNCTMKNSIGVLLADTLRYYYFDSDSVLEQAAGGKSAAKTLHKEDEKGYRKSESEVLKQLSSMGRLVICAGDGAVQSSTNLALLRHGISIWIDVPLDAVANEIMARQASSPITQEKLDSDGLSQVRQELLNQYNELKGGYATADATVSLQKIASLLGHEDFASVTAEDMALEVLKGIEKLTRVKKMMEQAAKPF